MDSLIRCSDLHWGGSLFGDYRSLTLAERAQLESQGNVACSPKSAEISGEAKDSSGWDNVFINSSSPSATLSRIRNCCFFGTSVYVGPLCGTCVPAPGELCLQAMPSGLYNVVFMGKCIIGRDVLIRNVSQLSNVVIGSYSCVMDCGSVVGAPQGSCFGVGGAVDLGPSTGGRGFKIHSNMSYVDVCRLALSRADLPIIARQRAAAEREAAEVTREYTAIGEKCYIMRCDYISGSIIGHSAVVISSRIERSALLSTSARPDTVKHASVVKCYAEEGVDITGPCRVETSMLFESAAVGEDAVVISSVLSPDASVAGAECSHSLVGPFIGIHHASLLIACTWPLGRGNVSYGAMLGANHTGRVNDQEFLSGEGCFYGLGVKLKFPFNSIEAPYSLFAAGTECLPQRISYPFSLISPPEASPPSSPGGSSDVSPAFNCVRPGWVLAQSPFTLLRSDMKFSKRKRSLRLRTDHVMARPALARLVVRARQRLRAMRKSGGDGAAVYYAEANDIGLGKNIMLEVDRSHGEVAYSSFLKLFALQALLDLVSYFDRKQLLAFASSLHRIVLGSSPSAAAQLQAECVEPETGPAALTWLIDDISEMYSTVTATEQGGMDSLGSTARLIIASEYPIADATAIAPEGYLLLLLGELRELAEARHALEVSCREKDAVRGARIIPDYLRVHGLVSHAQRDQGRGEAGDVDLLRYRDVDAVLAESTRRCRAISAKIELVENILQT